MNLFNKSVLTVLSLSIFSSVTHADVLSDIKNRGTLVCGTLGTSEPFSFQDPQTRQVIGYEVDLCKEIANHLNVQLDIKMIAVAARIPELIAGRVDIVAANLGWSPERAKQIDYSFADYVSPQKILIRSTDKDKYKKISDFKGKRVSAVSGSSSESNAKKLISEVKTITFKDPPSSFVALQQKKVEGFVGSELMLLKFQQESEKTPIKMSIVDEPLFTEPWGLGIKKGEDALRQEVNNTFTELEKSGKAQQIFDKWFGPDTNFHTKRIFKLTDEIK